jgi:hypothetical protein
LFQKLGDEAETSEKKTTGDSAVLEISEQFRDYIKQIAKSEMKYVMKEGGVITPVKGYVTNRLGVIPSYQRIDDGKPTGTFEKFRTLEDTINEVKEDLEQKRHYERMIDYENEGNLPSERSVAGGLSRDGIERGRPKSFAGAKGPTRVSMKKSVSGNPNLYFQFFKQLVRKTPVDFEADV